MAIAAWVMMGLAIWHFMIWLPDKVVGGIVGAFVIAGVGGVLGGLIINGFDIPGRADLGLGVALEGIPGALILLGIGYAIGSAQERREAGTAVQPRA